jgi:hypothetical protein
MARLTASGVGVSAVQQQIEMCVTSAGVCGVADAGFLAGAYLGAAIEGQGCVCDDPGMLGAMIGAPIGDVAGAVVGVKLS